MSNRKKLPKKKETTDYTLDDFVEDESQKWGDFVGSVMKEATEGGQHGVMIIATEKAFVCDLVPFGKVFHAKDSDAYDRFVASKEQ